MIIACPQCDTRFVVPSTIFRDGPRKVRCASCKHVWVQDESLDKEEEKQEDVFSDHLERAVETPSESFDDNDESDRQGFLSRLKNDFKTGFKIIAAACVTVLFLFFVYQFLTPPVVYGEGLAFNNMTVTREDDGMRLTGEIVNSFNEKRGVPAIEITSILAEGIEGDSILITPDQEILEGGEALPVSTLLENLGPEVQNLNITFSGAVQKSVETTEIPSAEIGHMEEEGHSNGEENY